jgi:hypothetical protein
VSGQQGEGAEWVGSGVREGRWILRTLPTRFFEEESGNDEEDDVHTKAKDEEARG